MSFMDYLNARDHHLSRLGLTSALLSGETPEQAAARMKKAREFDVPVGVADAITPEEIAERQAQAVDWMALQTEAPQLSKRLEDANFATLVKDDVTNTGWLEHAVWKLAPEPGKPSNYWEMLRNSGARGAYSIAANLPGFGAIDNMEKLKDELAAIEAKEAALLEGTPVSEVFGSEADPSGERGRHLFEISKERDKKIIKEMIERESNTAVWSRRMQGLFQQSDVMTQLSQAKTFGEAAGIVMRNPLEVIANVAFESLTQMAPTLPLMAFFGAGAPGMLATLWSSGSFDRAAQIMEGLENIGVNVNDADALADAFTNPVTRGQLNEVIKEANAHAGMTGLADAASFGLAGKTLLPKKLVSKLSKRGTDFANNLVQAPVQGFMGAAGEAAGQYNAKGEVTNWGDVVAEFVGEFSTAPIEVLASGVKATEWAQRREAKAQQQQQALQVLSQAVQSAKIAERDPETTVEFLDQVAESAGVSTLYVSPQSLQQAGVADQVRALSPTINEKFDEALETGSEIAIPTSEYVMTIAKNGGDDKIRPMFHSADTPSLQQAQEDAQAIQETLADKAIEEVKQAASVQKDLTVVGQRISEDLKAIPEVTPDEARGIRASVLAAVGALARDMGVSPIELWDNFGARIFAEPRVRRDEQGNLIVDEKAVREPGLPKGGEKKGPHGEFFPTLKLIARWKSADRSTLLHETGHMFLEMRINAMRELLAIKDKMLSMQVAFTKGQNRVVEVGQAILDWAGVKSIEEWDALSEADRKAIHEKWARSYEAYVMEGQAPVSSLKAAFREFTKMLKGVYASWMAIPGQALDDTTRELFDNIFMSSGQARTAEIETQGSSHISVEDLGLSPVEGVSYNKAIDDMYDQAETEQMARAGRLASWAKNLRKKAISLLKRQANGILQTILDEVENEYKTKKIWKAWNLFKNGRKVGDAMFKPKLLWRDLIALGYSAADVDKLYQAGIVVKNQKKKYQTLTPMDYALELGYGNDKELIDDLIQHHDLPDQIKKAAADRFVARHPALKDGEAIESTAALAWFNEAKLRVLDMEITAMERLAKTQERTETKAFEAIARANVAQQKREELKPHVYARAAQVAARNARKAFKKGDVRSAIFFKRQEIYQTAMAKSAKEAQQGEQKFKEAISKYTKKKPPENLYPECVEIVQRLLAAVGLTTLDHVGLNPSPDSISDMLTKLVENTGLGIDADPALLAAIQSNGPQAIETVGALAQLYDMVKQLNHLGRLLQHITIEGKKANLNFVVGETSKAIEESSEERGIESRINREGSSEDVKVKNILRAIGMSHARIPSLLAAIEGTREGKLFDFIIAPMDRCGSKAETMKIEFAKRLDKAFAPVKKALLSTKRVTYKSVGLALTKQQVFAIALNTGNDGNFDRLANTNILPDQKPLTREQVLALMSEALTSEELKAVQEVWNVFEQMRPELEGVAKRIIGRAPLWVKTTSRTVMGSDGVAVELKGGYYPIVYDKQAGGLGTTIEEIKEMADLSSFGGKGGVFDGMTMRRNDNAPKDAVLSLTLRGAFEGLDRQIHYIAWAEWVNDTRRFMNKLKPTVIKYWGKDAYKAIETWIDDVRTGGRKPSGQADRIADVLRSNVSLAGIGLNLVTALIQPLGLVQSFPVVGSKWMARGLREFIAAPLEARKRVAELSPMMANRMETQFREIAEIQAKITGEVSDWKDKLVHSAYVPLTVAQMAVDMPTWLGAYNKALAEGNTDQRAIALADRAVIDSQGSGRVQDLSGVERGNAWNKLFTVYYTFFNTALNLAMVSRYTKKPLEAAVDMMMILVLQPVIESVLRSLLDAAGDDEELDEDWVLKAAGKAGRDVIGFNLSLFAGLREISYIVSDYNSYSGPSGLRKITDTGRAITKWGKAIEEGEVDINTITATVDALGVWSGLPTVPVKRAIKGGHALWTGETDNYSALFLGYDPN